MKNKLISITVLLSILLFICCSTEKKPVLDNLTVGFYKTDVEYVPCELNEVFSPDATVYTATFDKKYTSTSYIIASLPEGDAASVVEITGAEMVAQDTFKVSLQTGLNIFEIKVTNTRGKTNSYSLTIDQQDLSAVYISEKIGEGIWRITDFGGFPGNENMYLIEGDGKAFLFDTGMGTGNLAEFIATLTSLPIEVVITHGHRDHVGQVSQFANSKVYVSKKDLYIINPEFVTPDWVYIDEGDVLELGNGRKFEVMDLPGQSIGHLVYIDMINKIMVVGDAVGSGDRLQMNGANRAPLTDLLKNLKEVEEKIKGLDGITLLTGHYYQEKTPLTGQAGKQLITDLRILTEGIISGEISGKVAFTNRNGENIEFRQAYYGLAGLWYNPEF